MKFSFALCLLLAAACSAEFSIKDIVLQPFVGLQEKAMRSLISAHAANDDPNLINECFGQYISDQQNTLTRYNKEYSTCVTTAQVAKDKVTAQSDAQRKDLLNRSDGMCGTLAYCEKNQDGLKFFDCYRDASADSYKVMFTLNSDANTLYNTVNGQYSNIDRSLTNCVDVARLEYARELEKCDNDFNVCVGNDVPTDAPTTKAPATEAPATEAPATEAPATEAPATEAPATEAPATEAPATEAPATEAPATEAPATEAPATEAPATEAPATEAPATEAPATEAPATEAPATEAPATEAPATEAPATEAPATEAPATEAPQTEAPATEAPATEAPATEAPATEAPATEAPATEAPATEAPATEAPQTEAPATEAPQTEAPATEAPATETSESTTERAPEEDLKFLPLGFKSKLQKLMNIF